MNKSLILLSLGLALAAPAWAHHKDDDNDRSSRRPVEEHRPLKADARVSIKNVAGMIDVEAWDRKEMELTGELGEDVEKLEITGNESSLKIEVKLPRDEHNIEADTRLRLKVPAGVTLDAQGVSADVRVMGLKGPLTVESVSGDVRIDVGSAKVTASSVSGDVDVQAPASEVKVNSVSGDVSVRGVRGEVRGETVSGEVKIDARDVRDLDVKTVSGDLHLEVELARDAEVNVETLSGEVRLALPAMPDGDLRLATFSGEISSPWWKQDEEEKEYRHEGSGKGRVRLHSFSGDIVLTKK